MLVESVNTTSYGISATIRNGREMLCLPYSEFLINCFCQGLFAKGSKCFFWPFGQQNYFLCSGLPQLGHILYTSNGGISKNQKYKKDLHHLLLKTPKNTKKYVNLKNTTTKNIQHFNI